MFRNCTTLVALYVFDSKFRLYTQFVMMKCNVVVNGQLKNIFGFESAWFDGFRGVLGTGDQSISRISSR